MADWDEDDHEEIIVGSDDFAIRVFKGEEIIYDTNESARILFLSTIKRNVFSFVLENGCYGVYFSRKRLWQQKSKAAVTALVGLDYKFDGQWCVAVGFESGKVEVRRHRTGELICSHQVSSLPI